GGCPFCVGKSSSLLVLSDGFEFEREGSDGIRNVASAGWVLSARFLPSEWFLERFSVKDWAVGTPVLSLNSHDDGDSSTK
ncbi:unnamed protein product, partial [Musa hybrid cultivar]